MVQDSFQPIKGCNVTEKNGKLQIYVDGDIITYDQFIQHVCALLSSMQIGTHTLMLGLSVSTHCEGWNHKLCADKKILEAVMSSIQTSPARSTVHTIDFSRMDIKHEAADCVFAADLPALTHMHLRIENSTGADDDVIWGPKVNANIKLLRIQLERALYSAMYNLGACYAQFDFSALQDAQNLEELDITWPYIKETRLVNVEHLSRLPSLKRLRLQGRHNKDYLKLDAVPPEHYWLALKSSPKLQHAAVTSLAIPKDALQPGQPAFYELPRLQELHIGQLLIGWEVRDEEEARQKLADVMPRLKVVVMGNAQF
jgi:hypothetical protein